MCGFIASVMACTKSVNHQGNDAKATSLLSSLQELTQCMVSVVIILS